MIQSRILAGLPVFRAVAVHDGFSAAAVRLGVTPSAVSQSIRTLEEHLGTRLFARTSRSLRLTEAGARFLAEIDGPLSLLSQAALDLRESEIQAEGPLRICLSRLALELRVMPSLVPFMLKHPAIRLEFCTDARPGDLVKGGFDAAISLREAPDGDMVALPIGPPLRRVLLASPEYLARHGAPSAPGDLIRHRVQRFRCPGSQRLEPLRFRQGDRLLELDPPPALVLDDIRDAGVVLCDGLVISQIYEGLLTGPIGDGRLVELLPEHEPAPEQFRIYYPSRIRQTARLQVFLDWFAGGKQG